MGRGARQEPRREEEKAEILWKHKTEGESGDDCAWPSATKAETGGEFVWDLEKSRPRFRREKPGRTCGLDRVCSVDKQASNKESFLRKGPKQSTDIGEAGALGESSRWQWCSQI